MRQRNRRILTVEQLETRYAPAHFVGTTLTYQDIDGDNVTVKFSKPLQGLTFLTAGDFFGPEQLTRIDFSGVDHAAARGVSITLTATPSKTAGGDGFAAIGEILAAGIDLGKVTIDGDLGRILCGDDNPATSGLTSLTALSMGAFGTSTGAANLNSNIHGQLGKLDIKGDMKAIIDANGAIGPVTVKGSLLGSINATSDIKSVTIGGNLAGDGSDFSGAIVAGSNIGPVKIGGGVFGNGEYSARILALNGKLASLSIAGDLRGGGEGSADVFSTAAMGKVKIGGSVVGNGESSALVHSFAGIASVAIGGNLQGGTNNSAQILANSDIGAVTIKGNVEGGAGSSSGRVVSGGALKSVTLGGAVLGNGPDSAQLFSTLAMGAVKIAGDLSGGDGSGSGKVSTNSTLKSVTIGGNLRGGGGAHSGQVSSLLAMGAVKIGEALFGDGSGSGRVTSGATIASVTIGESLHGGFGAGSGVISAAGALGAVKIGADVIGMAAQSGRVISGGALASVTIGGTLQGGFGNRSGTISAEGAITTVTINGNLQGGNAGSSSLEDTGLVEGKSIKTMTVRGSFIAGTNNGVFFANNGAIRAADHIGSLTIGSIVGNATHQALISARGQAAPGKTDLAIGKLTVTGSVVRTLIRAGYNLSGAGVNGDAQIGTVTVGGDWITSSLVAGAGPGADGHFGIDDLVLPRSKFIFSTIKSVTIKGQVFGSSAVDDHFGFVAEIVASIKVGGKKLPTTAGFDEILIEGTDDVRVNEALQLPLE